MFASQGLPAAQPAWAGRSFEQAGLTFQLAQPAASPLAGVWGADAAAADELNAGWARVTVLWESVEPSDNGYSWDALDRAVA